MVPPLTRTEALNWTRHLWFRAKLCINGPARYIRRGIVDTRKIFIASQCTRMRPGESVISLISVALFMSISSGKSSTRRPSFSFNTYTTVSYHAPGYKTLS